MVGKGDKIFVLTRGVLDKNKCKGEIDEDCNKLF